MRFYLLWSLRWLLTRKLSDSNGLKIIKVCKDFKERFETRAEGKAFREIFLNDLDSYCFLFAR